jgi:hypothetical protein
MYELWSAATADELHRVLVLFPPARKSADAFEPFALCRKHHESDPAGSLATAVLLLTDRRWRNGAAQLVRRIADSGILDSDELDLLARTFLAAGDAVYWRVPDEWLDDTFEVELADNRAGDRNDVPAEGPVVARREIAPPLRRWAAAHEVGRTPTAWAALLARTRELPARSAAAIAAGLLDRIDVLTPEAQAFVVAEATTWPDHTVRRLALGIIAARDGAESARLLGGADPNARIRSWAASLTSTSPTDQPSEVAEQPTLFCR